MSITPEAVAANPAFQRLQPSTLSRLAGHALRVVHHAGENFYEQGDPPTGLFLLQSGRVKLYRRSGERLQILALPMPGDCFGAESIAEDAASPFTATALRPTTSVYIPPQPLKALIGECPDLQECLLEIVSARLRQFVGLVHDLAFCDVTTRLAAVLMNRVEAEGVPVPDGVQIERLLSQAEFAALVGTAREVISRTFKRLETEGCIRHTPDSIVVLDPVRLSDIAGRQAR